jgi:hypothetical protein
MSNLVKNTAAISMTAEDDPWSEVANEGGGQFGKVLKFAKGQWLHADATVANGTEFLALMREALRGDVKFQGGKPVEHRLGLVRNRAKFAKRADLDDLDQSVWDRDKMGRPIDPWSPQTILPMIHLESGELYSYIFRSDGAKRAFRDLCRLYSPYRSTGLLPIISLQADRYKHDDYGWIDVPVLRVERMEDAVTMVGGRGDGPDPNGGQGAKVVGRQIDDTVVQNMKPAPPPQTGAELSDEVPF